MRTAFLIDGSFFLKRYGALRGSHPPETVARALFSMCLRHLRKQERDRRQLYRIFYYDCPPLTKKAHNPITRQAVDFSKTDTAKWRSQFFEQLKKHRKVALRLGYLNDRSGRWSLNEVQMRELLKGELKTEDIRADHLHYEVRQKGVDMRIGLDIASMAFKKQVDQMILVAGDSDFVPAAKLARREGIDFLLDPMWSGIRPDLHEHIDGLYSVIGRPGRPKPASDAV